MSDQLLRLVIQQRLTASPRLLTRKLITVSVVTAARRHSTVATVPRAGQSHEVTNDAPCVAPQAAGVSATGLHRLSTPALARNLFLGATISSPMLFNLSSAVLRALANTQSRWLNPDANPILRALVKPFFYDQFCAGTTKQEIFKTRDSIRRMGFAGVILCYAKEVEASASNKLHSTGNVYSSQAHEIERWKESNLETLDMIGEGDWIGLKLTGAGPSISQALMDNKDPPPEFLQALDAICYKTASQNCRLWIDAEQQVFQAAIDRWAVNCMRKHNTNGRAIVYNTLQAYLKSAPDKLKQQASLAASEGWTLALKLVRGAYIANDKRDKIHDSKQNTDDCYNGIVADVLSGDGPSLPSPPPAMTLFLAGHNLESVSRAWKLAQDLSAEGRLKIVPEFGQLQGMADELSCKLLQDCEAAQGAAVLAAGSVVVPKVYKCLQWGSIQECMQYLLRRLAENKGCADRMRDGMAAFRGELWGRLFGRKRRTG